MFDFNIIYIVPNNRITFILKDLEEKEENRVSAFKAWSEKKKETLKEKAQREKEEQRKKEEKEREEKETKIKDMEKVWILL